MIQASEQIARQFANSANVRKTWQDIVINVKEYGAKGDGVTDDTTAIQASINYANSVGKREVTFPAGTYKYGNLLNTDDIVIVGDGVTLEGGTHLTITSYPKIDYVNGLVFGEEYLAAWHKKVITNDTTQLNIVLSGDSTTENYLGTADGLDVILANYLNREISIRNYRIYGSGHSGKKTTDWLNDYLAGELALNPDLYIIRWGINDAVLPNALAVFESNYRACLDAIRASKGLDTTSIILMTPNSTTDAVQGRNMAWHSQINQILRNLAREYHCMFFDTFQMFSDSENAGGWMDTLPEGHIHPQGVMNQWIVSKLTSHIIPVTIRTANGFNCISNLSEAMKPASVSYPPDQFLSGINMNRCTDSLEDGFLITFNHVENMIMQISVPYFANQFKPMRYRYAWGGNQVWSRWFTFGGLEKQAYTTALRPTTDRNIGDSIFDTTLGKPIWWNGSVWKDAAGTTV